MGILSETLGLLGKRRQIARATQARADLDGSHRAEIGEPRNEGAVGEQMHDLLTQQQAPVQHSVEPESEVTVVSQSDEPNETLQTTQTEDQTGELPPVDSPPAQRSILGPDINDPQPWRDRAEEARAQAENMNSVFKKTMLTVAAHYELLAKRAERRRDRSG